MFKRHIMASAAAMIALGTTIAGTTAQEAPRCDGEMTIERLSDPACTFRIAVPTFRADAEAAMLKAELPLIEPVYVEAPTRDGGTRTLRMVGARFLEPQDERIDFRARTAENANFMDRMMFAAASYLGFDDEDGTRIADAGEDGNVLAIEGDMAALATPTRVAF